MTHNNFDVSLHLIILSYRPTPRYKVTVLSDNKLAEVDADCKVKTNIPQNNGKKYSVTIGVTN